MTGGINFSRTDLRNLEKLRRKSPGAFRKAEERAGLQMLTWMNNGSPNESRKPPIRWGFLRGSSSVFVGNRYLGAGPPPRGGSGAGEPAEPNKSHTAESTTITWGYNAEYAAKMHEWTGGWGEFTVRDGDAGNKWVEKHLQADKDALMSMIAKEFKKEAGT